MIPTDTLIHNIDFSMITQTNKAVAIFDTNLCFIDASKNWFKIHRFQDDELRKRSILDIFPKTSKTWKSRYQECLKGKLFGGKQVKHTLKDGSVQWVKWEISPWRNYEGEIAGLLLRSKDITQRKTRELEAKRNKKFLDEIGEIANVGGWEYTVATNKLFWTSATRKIHGVDENYVPTLEKAIDFLEDSRDTKKTYKDIDKAIKKGKPYNVELKIITAQGEERWINTNGKAEFKNGKCVRLYGTIQNIHNRKLKEIEIIQSEERFRKTFNNATTGMMLVDPKSYHCLEINQNACQIFGYSKEELLKLTLRDLQTTGVTCKSITAMERLYAGEISSFKIEEKYLHKDGHKVHIEFGASVIRDIDDKVINYICQIRDITEIKKKEKAIKTFIKVTRDQNKRLLNFAHIVSHNLRSHTSNFSMLLDLYGVEKDIDQKKEIMKLLNDASCQLAETIDNLSEVVAFNSNINKIKEPTNLRNCVTKIKSSIEGLVKENNATIINTIPEDLSIPSVPAYMESILLNLTTNSIKYKSFERSPVIKFSTTNVDDQIILSVEDNGRGIDLKRYGHKLFGMYKTFHGNEDARGIGLFITKNQVEALGGKIEAESIPEKGTSFKIHLNKN